MGMQTDVKSATITESGSVFGGPARVKSFTFVGNGSAGSVVLKDGGDSGSALLTQAVPGVADMYQVLIPDTGVRFETDVYATVANVTSLMVFYG